MIRNSLGKQLVQQQKQQKESGSCAECMNTKPPVKLHAPLLNKASVLKNSMQMIYYLSEQLYLENGTQLYKRLGFDILAESDHLCMNCFQQLVHPDDLHPMLNAKHLALKYLITERMHDMELFKLILTFRMRNGKLKNNHTFVLMQLSVYQRDKQGMPTALLVICDVLADKATKETPQKWLMHIDTEKLHLFSNGKILSVTEKKILEQLAQGYNSKEIAEMNCMSECTVNNHRQNILTSTQSRNTTQAVFFAKCFGLI